LLTEMLGILKNLDWDAGRHQFEIEINYWAHNQIHFMEEFSLVLIHKQVEQGK